MNPFQSYHGSLIGSIGTSHIQEVEGVDDLSSAPEEEEGSGMPKHKSDEAAKRHALAERERRVRIKRHFDTLRHLFPNLLKTDKASLLTEAVRRVKELKQVVADLVARQEKEQCSSGSTTGSLLSYFLPSEDDEFTVSYCNGGAEGKTVKATVCCEDRPCLNRDLTAAVRSVRGTMVRVEMATVGGRTKAVVVVVWRGCGGGGEEDVETLRRALKAVVEDRALGSSGYLGLPSSSWAELGQELPCVGKRARTCSGIEQAVLGLSGLVSLSEGLEVRALEVRSNGKGSAFGTRCCRV
ncbi:hypothetical protein RJ639_031421 [Escallonia herrerae]|uniref:BHLH domain-containing protein n=1 Tax=Escallonia herrerae TaxID=1293975 RepID=A0AA89BDV1_9ASTE|nr:hypothetical protein RJ639_031421 [Escallonia herrerae]